MNTALAAARNTEGRVFLGDFDLACGLVRFMLRIQNSYSVIDATERIFELDDHVWAQLASSTGKLDTVRFGAELRERPFALR